ncbi:MAG: PEP-CTERM sorting domain-containing protein [Puniceicoccales bacterium]
MKTNYTIKLLGGFFGMLALCLPVHAGYFTTITIDGDFSDWSGVPLLVSDSTGDGNPVDMVALYAANDDDYLYIRVEYSASVAVNGTNAQIFIALDNDNNAATGYDVYSLGVVGSEAGWQNDFPFAQDTGVFNSGGITDGAALIAPYNTTTNSQEIAISLDATFTSGGTSVFPNETFALAMYSAGTTVDDFIGAGVYTLAVPEPAEYASILALVSIAGVMFRRRRK